MDDWMLGLVNVCVGCLLVVAWAYGRLSHARGRLPIGLRGFTPRQRPSRSTTYQQPSTHSTNHASNHPSNHLSDHSPPHPSIRPSIHPSILPILQPPVHRPLSATAIVRL